MAIGDIIEENVGAKISLLGFSVGATVAWLLSGNGKIDSATCFYGSRIRNHLDIQPSADVDLYFCREKGFDVEEMIGTLNAKQRVFGRPDTRRTRLLFDVALFLPGNRKSEPFDTNLAEALKGSFHEARLST